MIEKKLKIENYIKKLIFKILGCITFRVKKSKLEKAAHH